MFFMVYVDDIVVTRNSSDEISQVIKQLHNKFSLKDMGELNFFLGIEVHRFADGMILSQKKYISEILHSTGMMEA